VHLRLCGQPFVLSFTASAAGQEIDIADFSLEQLGGVKRQLEEELELLTNNVGNLKLAMNKFEQGHSALKELGSKPAGTTLHRM